MIFPLLPKLRTTPRSLTQTTIANDAVSPSLTSRKLRARLKRNSSSLKHGVAFLLLGAAALLPASSLNAQVSQKEFLRQQAEALKAQMVRAQVEQAADPGFAQKAYEAQQKYLLDTAEKSFRIGKPQSTRSHLVTGQAESYQAPPAIPPVHVAPTRHSVPPQRVAYAQQPTYAPQPNYAAQHPPAYPQQAPQARLNRAEFGDQGESISSPANRVGLQDRLTSYLAEAKSDASSLPKAAESSYQREAISTPANRVGLQDRLSSYLTKPKYRTGELPVPEFDVDQNKSHAAPTPAKREPKAPQPKFAPEPISIDLETLPEPEVSQIDEAAYERMAAAIAEREVDRAVAFEDNQASNEIVQTSTFTPPRQVSVFSAPPRKQQSSVPTFYAPTETVPTLKSAKPIAAEKVSVLSRPTQQDDDDSLINRLRNQQNELPQPDSDDSDFDSLRPPEPVQRDQEKEDLEKRLRELEEETERRDTKRRQRELEAEERRVPDRRRRNEDLRGEITDDSDDIDNRPVRLTCDQHRSNLLGRSIRDISLDISPRASRIRDQYIAISRSWTDRLGNVIATGAMADLRRGYVIIDGINGRQKIPYSKLSDADWAAVSDYWQIPELCSIGDNRLPQRHWVPQSFTWTASSLCHKPLYFENQQLERYGHTHGPILQPIHSTAHFFVSLATLPYATAIHPPNECRYALGYYRPGNCAPWLKNPIPISLDGLRRQAAVTTGLSFIP